MINDLHIYLNQLLDNMFFTDEFIPNNNIMLTESGHKWAGDLLRVINRVLHGLPNSCIFIMMFLI
jgi:hypothetical protein